MVSFRLCFNGMDHGHGVTKDTGKHTHAVTDTQWAGRTAAATLSQNNRDSSSTSFTTTPRNTKQNTEWQSKEVQPSVAQTCGLTFIVILTIMFMMAVALSLALV